ncbi:DUF4112 domain-containing protein [Prevotella melaninogenica]|uniref:DUF4112 domain-containing protein n=1 Tax=Prevotella melaninogenica TaxID=28132 RepID=UPI001C5F61D1|nr:DUF4112 domain-containing protein [Prevotella melaninogenica]MBW4901779.1 DUF4112 domain-containing protein [Prevotella melaninogenica]
MEGKNILENELNYDAHKTLGEQDGEIVLNDSYSLIDDRDSLDKGSDATRKEEVRRQRREKEIRELKASKAYKFISTVTTLADRYFLDALLGLVPSVGDLVSSIFGLPFIYVTLFKVKSIPLTLAVIYNYLVDILLGSIPFFIGDAIDFFSKAHVKNLDLITRYVEGDKKTIRQVRSKALLTAFLIIILSVIIYFVFRLLIGVTAWTWTLLIDMFKWLIGLF